MSRPAVAAEPLAQLAAARAPAYSESQWTALSYFNVYRLIIALLFASLALIHRLPPHAPNFDTRLSAATAAGYLLFSVGMVVLIQQRRGGFALLRNLQVPVDVLALMLFVHASGGVTGGFGILLVVATAGACLLAGRRAAVAYASLATLALLGQTLFGILRLDYQSNSYTHAALLGLSCFVTGVLAAWMGEQVRRSAALAAERELELNNLASLNDYVVQRMHAGIFVLDGELKVELANRAALRMVGRQESVVGLPLNEVSGVLGLAWRAWRQRGDNRRTPLALGPDCAEVIVSFTQLGATRSSTLVFMDDATEIQQRAQQIKLASLGRLTASIAHEIRNPLGAISHAGQLLSESGELPAEDRRLVQIIGEHSARMDAIIRNVLSIGRRELAQAESFPFLPWLRDFIVEFGEQRHLPPEALSLVAEDAEIIVHMDKSQLHQVLWNLGENALRYSLREPLLSLAVGREGGGRRAFLDVTDTGRGMTEAVADQVFEPFFTTDARGTGLGLYLARELCEANNATLSLLRHDAQGCTFRLSFYPPGRAAVLN